jgi:hypothetical protein
MRAYRVFSHLWMATSSARCHPHVPASLTMSSCHVCYPGLSVHCRFCRRRTTFADRNLHHHIESSVNRSIGRTPKGGRVNSSPPLSSRPRGSPCAHPTSCFFSIFPIGVATPATAPGTCPPMPSLTQVKGCRLIGVFNLGRTSSQPEMISKRNQGVPYCYAT